MPYYSYDMNEKIEMSGFETLEAAHRHCKRSYHPMNIIFEGHIEDDFKGDYGIPVAMYIKGERFDITPHKE
jgi:hypothetical protein